MFFGATSCGCAARLDPLANSVAVLFRFARLKRPSSGNRFPSTRVYEQAGRFVFVIYFLVYHTRIASLSLVPQSHNIMNDGQISWLPLA